MATLERPLLSSGWVMVAPHIPDDLSHYYFLPCKHRLWCSPIRKLIRSLSVKLFTHKHTHVEME